MLVLGVVPQSHVLENPFQVPKSHVWCLFHLSPCHLSSPNSTHPLAGCTPILPGFSTSTRHYLLPLAPSNFPIPHSLRYNSPLGRMDHKAAWFLQVPPLLLGSHHPCSTFFPSPPSSTTPVHPTNLSPHYSPPGRVHHDTARLLHVPVHDNVAVAAVEPRHLDRLHHLVRPVQVPWGGGEVENTAQHSTE